LNDTFSLHFLVSALKLKLTIKILYFHQLKKRDFQTEEKTNKKKVIYAHLPLCFILVAAVENGKHCDLEIPQTWKGNVCVITEIATWLT